MKLLILTLAFVGIASAVFEDEFADFKDQFGKEYVTADEEQRRFSIFQDNYLFVQRHNEEAANGIHTYTVGINEFADMTSAEFLKLYTGTFISNHAPVLIEDPTVGDNLPASVDWRKKGYVTPIKNQAQCGSCWAFSAIGSIEGAHFNKTGKLVSLSEQNIVDCDKTSYGCNGGLMTNAFKYVIGSHGVDTEKAYPYTAKDGECKFDLQSVGATIKSYREIQSQSEIALKAAAARVGPISVAIDASHPSFQLYSQGIYTEPDCSTTELDHGVLVVGYGSDNGSDFWIVKNSWGESWGMDGYIHMSRNNGNMCGIATSASFPLA